MMIDPDAALGWAVRAEEAATRSAIRPPPEVAIHGTRSVAGRPWVSHATRPAPAPPSQPASPAPVVALPEGEFVSVARFAEIAGLRISGAETAVRMGRIPATKDLRGRWSIAIADARAYSIQKKRS